MAVLLLKCAPKEVPFGGLPGKVAEWSKAPDSKSGVRFSVPWVRIPPFPPYKKRTRGYFLSGEGAGYFENPLV